MKPKEKAEEILSYFDYPNIKTGLMSVERKQCAMICARMSLGMFEDVFNKLILGGVLPKSDIKETETYKFWEEVKKEIENI